MSAVFTMRNAVLFCMALALILGAFADVVPGPYAPYVKAAAVSATGLAGLFMHPPSVGGDAPEPIAAVTVPVPAAVVAVNVPPTTAQGIAS